MQGMCVHIAPFLAKKSWWHPGPLVVTPALVHSQPLISACLQRKIAKKKKKSQRFELVAPEDAQPTEGERT